MDYGLIETSQRAANDCFVLGLFSEQHLQEFSSHFHQEQMQLIERLFKKTRHAGDIIWQSEFAGQGLCIIHCGEKNKFNRADLGKRLDEIAHTLIAQNVSSATICIPLIPDHTSSWQLQFMLLRLDTKLHQVSYFKSKNNEPPALKNIQFTLPHVEHVEKETLVQSQKIAEAVRYTRSLADMPANICTPTYLATQAENLAKNYPHITTKSFELAHIKQMGMGAFVAVAQGSVEEPRFIEIHYQGHADSAPIVFVGKGITFDSGGLSIKPASVMDEMKYDMAGAATVLGVLQAAAALQLPINLIGLIASAENMPSGNAVKPGDIVTSLSGQTIEILNTDAEGRLVLADALTYAEQFNPEFVIDIATLTGAVIIALGECYQGLMTPDEELATMILNAAKESDDKTWRLPLDESYHEALKSPFADMINASFDRSASAIVAATFLSNFTQKYRWAHLDIAGTAWVSGKKRHATGRPVRLLIQFLQHVINTR